MPRSSASTKSGAIPTVLQQTLIYGLLITQNSSTSIAVSAGSCWDPSSNTIITYAGGTNSPTLGASLFYAVYLYSNAGTATLDIQQEDPPSTVYAGSARKRASGNGGRYIGSFLTDASSHVYSQNVAESGDNQLTVAYVTDIGVSPFRVLAAGTATTFTTQSFAAAAPRYVISEVYMTVQLNLSTTAAKDAYVEFSLDGTNRSAYMSLYIGATTSYLGTQMWLGVNPSTPNIYYRVAGVPAGGGPNVFIDVGGYRMAR